MVGHPPRGGEGRGEGDVLPMHHPVPPQRPPVAVGALRQGLSVQLGRSVAWQLEALMMVSRDTPACWSAALQTTPALMAAGNPQW